MAHPSTFRDTWQSIRRLPSRTPLRVKLITAVLALVGVALVIISVAGVFAFRDYLITRADDQVRRQYDLAILAVQGGQPGFHLFPGQLAAGGSFVTAWRLQGHQLNPHPFPDASAPLVKLPDVPLSQAWVRAHAGRLVTVAGLNSQDRWQVIAQTASYPGPDGSSQTGTLIVGVDLGDISGSIARLAAIDAIVGALVLVGLAIVGVAVVRASLRPLTDIEQTAQAIAAGDLSRRVPERDPSTEVGRLGRSLNTMLAQIETAFRARTASEGAARRSEEAARHSALAASRSEERMRQFVADASHELRTPLTAIRGFAEYYRQRGGVEEAPIQPDSAAPALPAGTGPAHQVADRLTRSDLDRIIQRVEQEAARMGVLVDDMLLLARLDQQRSPDFRIVDLLAIAADALHDARVIAPARAINLTVGTPDAPLVIGDEVGLRQVIGNLMSNAMTHTPDGTPIDITIKSGTLGNGHRPTPVPTAGTGGGNAKGPGPEPSGDAGDEPAVILEVADQGPGLTDDQKEHVFERFYRTDRARSRTAGGTGLGLAIVAALISAHRGRVWVDSEPGHGATFGFAVPLAPEARPPGDTNQA